MLNVRIITNTISYIISEISELMKNNPPKKVTILVMYSLFSKLLIKSFLYGLNFSQSLRNTASTNKHTNTLNMSVKLEKNTKAETRNVFLNMLMNSQQQYSGFSPQQICLNLPNMIGSSSWSLLIDRYINAARGVPTTQTATIGTPTPNTQTEWVPVQH